MLEREVKVDDGSGVLSQVDSPLPVHIFTWDELRLLRSRLGGMIDRCHSDWFSGYADYGGRGIRVCDEWRNPVLGLGYFLEWARTSGFEAELQIDRIDNDGNYEPGNCRWVTSRENGRNKRNSHMLTAWGETKCGTAWADDERCKVDYPLLMSRIYNKWNTERAISEVAVRRVRNSDYHPNPALYYEAFGESKTLAQWMEDERLSGIGNETLRKRFNSERWTNEQAITYKKHGSPDVDSYEAFGESKSLRDWSRDVRCLCGFDALRYRVNRRHFTMEGAMLKQDDYEANNLLHEAFGESKTIDGWLKDERCSKKSYSCLYGRFRSGELTNEDAIVFPVHWKRSSER